MNNSPYLDLPRRTLAQAFNEPIKIIVREWAAGIRSSENAARHLEEMGAGSNIREFRGFNTPKGGLRVYDRHTLETIDLR